MHTIAIDRVVTTSSSNEWHRRWHWHWNRNRQASFDGRMTRRPSRIAFIACLAYAFAFAFASNATASSEMQAQTRRDARRDALATESDPIVVVLTMDGHARALDARTGQMKWQFDTGGALTRASMEEWDDNERTRDERCVFPGVDGALYARAAVTRANDRSNGEVKRVIRRLGASAKELAERSPRATTDGGLVVGRRASAVYVLDARTGEMISVVDVDGTTKSVREGEHGENDDDDVVYVGRVDNVVRSVDAKSGEERWNVTHGELRVMTRDAESGVLSIANAHARVKSAGGSTFAIGPGNAVRALDAKTGELKWSAKMSSIPLGVSDARGNVIVENVAQVQSDGDRIIVGAHAGGLFALPYTESAGAGLVDGSASSGALVPLGDQQHFVRIDIDADEDDWSFIPEDLVRDTLERTERRGESSRWRNDLIGVAMSAVAGVVVVVVFGRKQDLSPSKGASNETTKDGVSDELSAAREREQLSAAAKKRAKKRAKQAETKAAEAELIAKVHSIIDEKKRDELRVGRLVIKPTVLGYGSCGTIVFEGCLDGRRVAVKRLLAQFHELARKELEALIASDEHPNILRCFALEEDADFVYIALELCSSSLARIVDPAGAEDARAAAEVLGFKAFDEQTMQATPQAVRILYDVASGLNALHEQGIVHRDLKPQNVLITANCRGKIADMGLAKRLNVSDGTSFETHIAGAQHTAGTSGWQAPERLTQGRQSRSVDVFSLGCLMYYTLTGGAHPFGARVQRDSNVIAHRFDLSKLNNFPEAQALVRACIDHDPAQRPSTKEILTHPMWWDAEKKIQFLIDASDRVELEDRMSDRTMLRDFEACASKSIACADWTQKLDKELLENLGRYRDYDGSSLRDLLRVIRNKANHYRELPPKLQRKLGSYPDGFWRYVSSRFPSLLLNVRAFFVPRMSSANEATLAKYFAPIDGSFTGFASSSASNPPSGAVDDPLVAPQIFPNRPGKEPCEFFVKTGRCKFGATCKFHHPLGLHWDHPPGEVST